MKRIWRICLLVALLMLALPLLGGCLANNGGEPPAQPGEEKPLLPEQAPQEPEAPEEATQPAGSERPASQEFTIELEGMEEAVTWTLYNQPGLFSIYYNAETLAAGESDVSFLQSPPPGLAQTGTLFAAQQQSTPAVYLWVGSDQNPAVTAESLAEQEWPEQTFTETSLGGYPALHLHSSQGTTAESAVYDRYLLNLPQGGYLYLEVCYFLEAAEGWGARLNAMADTIELL